MGLWLTSSPEISKKKSVEVRCIITHKTATTDSARPNNINSFRNHFLNFNIFPNPDENPFYFRKSISYKFGVFAFGIHMGGGSTQLKPRSHNKKDEKTIYGSNISLIYYLNKSSKSIKSVDLVILHIYLLNIPF